MKRILFRQKYIICIAIFVIMLLATSMSLNVNLVYASSSNLGFDESILKPPTGAQYTMTVPPLEDRLTRSGNINTLFAPYTTKSSGLYDVNKTWSGDTALCWATSCANVIAWYLDSIEKSGMQDVSTLDRDPYKIFNNFKSNWQDTGYDPIQGFSWYMTGKFTSGDAPSELINKNSGGYLSSLDKMGNEQWSIINQSDNYMVFGNYGLKQPFIEEVFGSYGDKGNISTHRNFSNEIIRQLHYGASVLSVSKEGVSGSYSHAVTLWGCDFNDKGLVTKLYLVDPDDYTFNLIEAKVTARNPDSDGIKLHFYPSGPGDNSPFTKVISSTLVYAGGVINHQAPDHTCISTKVSNPATCLTTGIVDYYVCKGCGKCYEDELMTRPIADIDAWKSSHILQALGHDYGEVSYTWNGNTCTATRVCKRDGYQDRIIKDAVIDVVNATCTTPGKRTYKVDFGVDWATSQEREESIDKLSHNYVEKSDDKYEWLECTLCGDVKDKVERAPVIPEVEPKPDADIKPEVPDTKPDTDGTDSRPEVPDTKPDSVAPNDGEIAPDNKHNNTALAIGLGVGLPLVAVFIGVIIFLIKKKFV